MLHVEARRDFFGAFGHLFYSETSQNVHDIVLDVSIALVVILAFRIYNMLLYDK